MALLSLLACVLLGALSAQAKVDQSFSECSESFYQGTEPSGMDQNAERICQKYDGAFHYATLYSTHHRIPVYSAYTFTTSNLGGTQSSRRSKWFIEPQLENTDYLSSESDSDSDSELDQEEMCPESVCKGVHQNQAVSNDYIDTGFDRGHLNPNSFHSGDDRLPTFTLTNAAPMDPCFNRVLWSKWEAELKNLLKEELKTHPLGTAYIVTGTVPHSNSRIPQRVEGDPVDMREIERVTVPTHFWTAVCFVDFSDRNNPYSFSFGYIGVNSAEGTIEVKFFPEMNSDLTDLYQHSQVSVFVDNCDLQKEKMKLVEKLKIFYRLSIKRENMLKLQMPINPVKRKYDMTSVDIQHKIGLTNHYDTLYAFFQESERIKYAIQIACLLTKVLDGKRQVTKYTRFYDELRKREVGSEAVQCRQVPEKSTYASMTSADGTRCQSTERYCKTESGFKPCCTSPCLYQEQLKSFWCFSGEAEIECSPQYSAITVTGEKCRDDHPCATYGEDYYWCYKGSWTWDYCSPPLWQSITKTGLDCRPNHACAKYGEPLNWCYTDDNGNWNECCTHDDCFTAIDDKTCRPNHPCGYHGESYLWCYTTDGSWDYCCKEC